MAEWQSRPLDPVYAVVFGANGDGAELAENQLLGPGCVEHVPGLEESRIVRVVRKTVFFLLVVCRADAYQPRSVETARWLIGSKSKVSGNSVPRVASKSFSRHRLQTHDIECHITICDCGITLIIFRSCHVDSGSEYVNPEGVRRQHPSAVGTRMSLRTLRSRYLWCARVRIRQSR